jgi:hypothetical protein
VAAIGALALNYLSEPHREVAETAPPKVEAPYADFFAKLAGVKAGDVDVGELTTSAVRLVHIILWHQRRGKCASGPPGAQQPAYV